MADYVIRNGGQVGRTADREESVKLDDNGIPVVEVPISAWCATAGDLRGFCGDPAWCRRYAGKSCVQQAAFACFLIKTATDGETKTVCAESYGRCKTIYDVWMRDPETVDGRECYVFRLKKKTKH